MNDHFETDVRRVLAEAADALPAGAVERLIDADYHPRTGWLTPWRAAGALVGIGAVGAGAATAAVLVGATPAFAGWTPTPKGGPHGLSAAADSSCQAQLASLPGAPTSGWSPVVTDVRGPYTLAVFEASGVYGTCITGPSLTEASVSGTRSGAASVSAGEGGASSAGSHERWSGSASGAVYTSGGIERSFQAHLDSSRGDYTIMEGEVASDVTSVTVTLSGGGDVGTTVGGGWFVAWWPNDEGAVSAQVTTATGTTSQPLS